MAEGYNWLITDGSRPDFSAVPAVSNNVPNDHRRNRRGGLYIETDKPLDWSCVKDFTYGKVEKKLDAFEDLKIGMEVAFGRMRVFRRQCYIYKHHGIITNIYDITKTFEIVELTAPGTFGNIFPAFSRSFLEPKVVKNCIPFKTKHLFYYDYKDLSYDDKIIKERAELMFHLFESSKIMYHLYTFNCEHFASYCTTGLAFSLQIRNINKTATDDLDDRFDWYRKSKRIPNQRR